MKIKLIFILLLLISYCYNNPTNNKVKPLYIRQYEELNRKQELKKKNKKIEKLQYKEKTIKFNKEENANFTNPIYRPRTKRHSKL